MIAERKRSGAPIGRTNKKRRAKTSKTSDRRNSDQPDFDPLTADTTIQKTEG